jgi:MFS family permease
MKQSNLFNRAYVALLCINLIVSISFYMLSTTITLYATSVGLTTAAAGTVVGVLSIASLGMRPFTGIISDRLERKRLLIASLLLISVAMAGCSLTASLTVLIFFRILHGIGFSLATTITMTLVAGTLPEERMTQGMGYFAIGQTISTAVAPALGLLLGEHFGYEITLRTAAALLILSAMLAAWTVESQPMGTKMHERYAFRLSDCFAVEAVPYGVLAILVSGCTGIENSFISLFGQQLHLGSVGWYFTLSAVALFVARMFGGQFADRNRMAIPLSLGVMALAFLLLGGMAGYGGAIIFACAAILKALGLGTVQPALQARSLNSVPEERRGAASCTYYLGTDIGQAFAPMAGGVAVQACGYKGMFLLAAVPVALAAAVVTVLGRKRRKEA